MFDNIHEIVISIKSKFNDSGFRAANTRVKAIQKLAKKMNKPFYEVESAVKSVGINIATCGNKGVRAYTNGRNGALKWAAAQKILENRMRRFPMHLLSIMFISMQMQKIFTDFLRDSIALYSKVTENQTTTGKALMKYQAALEFFKFSIVESLSELIIYFTELASGILDFISANPGLMKMVSYLTLIGGAAFTTLYWITSIGMGLNGWTELVSKLNISMPGMFTTMGTSAKTFFTGLLSWIPLIAFIAYFMYKVWTNSMSAIGANEKAELAKSKEDWDSYISFVTGRNISLKFAVLKTFMDIFYEVTNIIKMIQDAWVGFISGILSFISPELAKLYEDTAFKFPDITEQYLKNVQGLYQLQTEDLIKTSGMSAVDIIDIMKQAGAMEETISRAFENSGIRGNELTNYWKAYNDAIDKATGSVFYFSESMNDIVTEFKEMSTDLTGIIPEFQHGDIMPHTGLAHLEAGERVLTPNQGMVSISLSPTYTINGNTDSALRRILEEHDRNLLNEISRMKLPGV